MARYDLQGAGSVIQKIDRKIVKVASDRVYVNEWKRMIVGPVG